MVGFLVEYLADINCWEKIVVLNFHLLQVNLLLSGSSFSQTNSSQQKALVCVEISILGGFFSLFFTPVDPVRMCFCN